MYQVVSLCRSLAVLLLVVTILPNTFVCYSTVHDYLQYMILYLHLMRFLIRSDELNPSCCRSAIGAERPILIPSTVLTAVCCQHVPVSSHIRKGVIDRPPGEDVFSRISIGSTYGHAPGSLGLRCRCNGSIWLN